MYPLLVCVQLLWNLKWKALLKLCKVLGFGFTAVLVFSTVATRRYCNDDTSAAAAGQRGMRYVEVVAKARQNGTVAEVRMPVSDVVSALQGTPR